MSWLPPASTVPDPWVPQVVRKIDRELAHAHAERDRLGSEIKEVEQRIETLEKRKTDEMARG